MMKRLSFAGLMVWVLVFGAIVTPAAAQGADDAPFSFRFKGQMSRAALLNAYGDHIPHANRTRYDFEKNYVYRLSGRITVDAMAILFDTATKTLPAPRWQDHTEEQLAQTGDVIVLLDSPGGDLATASRIAQLFIASGVTTIIDEGARCLSSCAFLFLSGSKHVFKDAADNTAAATRKLPARSMHHTATLGFHRPRPEAYLKAAGAIAALENRGLRQAATQENTQKMFTETLDTVQRLLTLSRQVGFSDALITLALATPHDAPVEIARVGDALQYEIRVVGMRPKAQFSYDTAALITANLPSIDANSPLFSEEDALNMHSPSDRTEGRRTAAIARDILFERRVGDRLITLHAVRALGAARDVVSVETLQRLIFDLQGVQQAVTVDGQQRIRPRVIVGRDYDFGGLQAIEVTGSVGREGALRRETCFATLEGTSNCAPTEVAELDYHLDLIVRDGVIIGAGYRPVTTEETVFGAGPSLREVWPLVGFDPNTRLRDLPVKPSDRPIAPTFSNGFPVLPDVTRIAETVTVGEFQLILPEGWERFSPTNPQHAPILRGAAPPVAVELTPGAPTSAITAWVRPLDIDDFAATVLANMAPDKRAALLVNWNQGRPDFFERNFEWANRTVSNETSQLFNTPPFAEQQRSAQLTTEDGTPFGVARIVRAGPDGGVLSICVGTAELARLNDACVALTRGVRLLPE